MDVSGIASLSSSMAETGIKQEVGYAVLKKAQQMQGQVAAQLIDALPTPQRLPSNLGNTINTTA
ncbi:putative motility protein [Massilia sp. CCM 8695]|uniref:Motility protein n=1 Tax=Massilia frigida TaxID=2609281 RepID=A0ABX0NJC0_9BURK|nr:MULTISPECIES: YjfB family protein [Massilia]MDM5180753.1 YjfB family protein [Massilia sp. DJPM01]NHZ82925.1 putative motility protein [Massilia frigida]